jgi:hypothetical protein
MRTKKINEFLHCLNEERFYDAHEVLENLWFPQRFTESCEVKILKGFINAAVSFELFKRGRSAQSKRVWANYLKYRQKIFSLDPSVINQYYQLSRSIETIHNKLH